MKVIALTQGQETLIDDCDYEYLMQWKWYFHQGQNHQRTGYARRTQWRNGQWQTILMHRLIATLMGLKPEKYQIDHADHNGLNNQRQNLRIATTAQNRANVCRRQDNTSGFKGVTWNKQNRRFSAYIQVNRQRFHLGYFNDPRSAAKAYNRAALKHLGSFACLNTIDNDQECVGSPGRSA